MRNAEWKQRLWFPGRFILSAFVMAAFLSACVQKGPVLVEFMYQPSRGLAAEVPKVTVAVSPFKDERGKGDSVAGKRFLELSGQENALVVQGTISSAVTAALKKSLEDREISVKDAAAWDLTDAGIPASGTDLLISGEIKTLWVESTSSMANTTAKANIELRISVADIGQKKVIRVLNVNSKIERDNVTYSTAFVQSTLSEALTGALNRIFSDEELKNKFK